MARELTADVDPADAPFSRWVALTLGLGAFLTQFDVTAVVVAMPAIGRDLGLSVGGYAWVMDAYSLAFTATLLAAGALADRHGRRRALLGGNLVFLAASLACGLAWDGPSLWTARAVQGIGAAFVVTGAIALVAGAHPAPADRARAFALIGLVSGVAMAAGPTLGGLVAGGVGWRWIFLVNLPLCALLAFGVLRLVAEERAVQSRRVDWVGLALLTLALGVFIEGLLYARTSWPLLVAGLVLGAALLGAFAVQQRRQAQPMLDPGVFARREMAGVAVVLLALSVGYWALLVYLPLFLTAAYGWSETAIGVALLAATLPMLVLPSIGARLATRRGWRVLFAGALAAAGAGGGCLAIGSLLETEPTRAGLILAGMVLSGVGAALAHPQLSGAVVALAPPEQAGMASAVTVIMRQGGFALGIAAMAATIRGDNAHSFAPLFAIATVASAGGAAAALFMLSAMSPGGARRE